MKKDYPLITIITATYKKFDKLYETMRSVFLQNYPNIEYIICDDGSDNFPAEEIGSFIKNNKTSNVTDIIVLHSEKNRGTVRNLNNAIKQSHGEYIFMLSCNDVFYNNNIVNQIADIFIGEQCDVITASRMIRDSKKNKMMLLPHYFERQIIEAQKTAKAQHDLYISERHLDMASGSVMYYSRRILEEYNYFDENYYLIEDGPFIEKYLRDHKIRTAYDIIAIDYDLGGVSFAALLNPDSPKNELYNKDNMRYRFNQRFEEYRSYDYQIKKILYYSKLRKFEKGAIKRTWTLFKFWDVSIPNEINRLIRKFNARIDRYIILLRNI